VKTVFTFGISANVIGRVLGGGTRSFEEDAGADNLPSGRREIVMTMEQLMK
jgi:hypothetical protein